MQLTDFTPPKQPSRPPNVLSSAPAPRNLPDEEDDPEEPTIQTLKYSIRNILQPDFGRTAVLRTKSLPHHAPTAGKIFKPYEHRPPPPSPEPPAKPPFPCAAPLGSLCQAVSQIGAKEAKTASRSRSPAKATPEAGDRATPAEEGKVPTLWPAWVYCTRYSDRPSSGKKS